MKAIFKVLSITLVTLFLFSCTKENNLSTESPLTGMNNPYFTVGNDTFVGIVETNKTKLYNLGKTLYAINNPPKPCDGQIDQNLHFAKFQEIKLIDTLTSNVSASLMLSTGSQSDFFKLKGDYEIPTVEDKIFNISHGSCIYNNQCGQANSTSYQHESSNFLFCLIKINKDYYYVYSATYKIPTYNDPLNGTIIGKAYKSKTPNYIDLNYPIFYDNQIYSGFNQNFDTLTSYDITAKFK